MLNLFGSISSVLYQFLVIESPFIQVIFMKKQAKNPLFEGLCYNLKGLELFSKTNLNLPGCLKGWKFDRICILWYHFGFWNWLFCPSPFKGLGVISNTNFVASGILWTLKICKINYFNILLIKFFCQSPFNYKTFVS